MSARKFRFRLRFVLAITVTLTLLILTGILVGIFGGKDEGLRVWESGIALARYFAIGYPDSVKD